MYESVDIYINIVFVLTGLVTLTEMKAKQEDVIEARQNQIARKSGKSKLAAGDEAVGKDTNSKKKKVIRYFPSKLTIWVKTIYLMF